jgi:acetyltransferase-like isoleucine patch superfamily enzyme/acyl carrier protein
MLEFNTERSVLRRFEAATAHGLARLALHGVDTLGARPRVHGRPFIENLGRTTIGDDLVLHSSPVRSHLVTGVRGALVIGDSVTIGAGAAIAAEERVEIGDGAHLSPFVMILDSDYHGTKERSARGSTAPIVIGAHAWLGQRVVVLHGAIIGAHARIEAGSVVSGIIPAGARASGVPARVVHAGGEHAERIAPSDLTARVQRVATEVFALPAPPDLRDGPEQIPGWDSLGALRLLISLEAELGILLPLDALAGVRDLEGLSDVAAQAFASRSLPVESRR